MTLLNKKDKDWFRLKRYPHIGPPLEPKDRGWIQKYLSDKGNIAKHAFFPFIHRTTKARKFRREIAHDGTRSLLRRPAIKERELFYANHLDSNIYSYYAQILSRAYEIKIDTVGIASCVTAYRRIKLNPNDPNSRNKSNVDFANDVFSYIRGAANEDLVAITFDIKKFFDSLDHKLLKKYWRMVIDDFSDDHYNVFRNITKFSYIEENDVFNHFKTKILVERNPALILEKSVKRKIHLRNKRAVAYCNKEMIKEIRDANLIKANKFLLNKDGSLKFREKGIPQGSPISAVLANIYLFEFDIAANNFISNLNGIYRRYSDDMIVVCKLDHKDSIIDFFTSKIKDYKLEIQEEKTQIFDFRYDKKTNRHFCSEYNRKTKKFGNNTQFEYLGFQFDGKWAMLKNSSLAGYYRKMKRSIKHGRFHAIHNKTKAKNEIFKSRLYKRFTQLGASRRRIFMRDPKDKSKFILSNKFDWGNYLTYAKMAARNIQYNKIESQIRNHWQKFHDLLSKPL